MYPENLHPSSAQSGDARETHTLQPQDVKSLTKRPWSTEKTGMTIPFFTQEIIML